MLSIEHIRQNPDIVREALARRNEYPPIDSILSLDAQRRSQLTDVEAMRSTRNRVSKELSHLSDKPQELLDEMRQAGDTIKILEQKVKVIESQLTDALLRIPNLPLSQVPDGDDETGNVVVEICGHPHQFNFDPLPHWDLGKTLDIIDLARASKISGSRFFTLKGHGARLQRALSSWMIDHHVQYNGYKEVHLPYLVRRDTMLGSGNLPKFADNLYHDDEDDLWLIPTAEVPLTGLHRDEVLSSNELPIYYVSHTPSFRREKAAAGKDTRGIKRVHQFEKVELYKLVKPDSSVKELQMLLNDSAGICKALDLPFRIVQLCAGDMGFPSAMSFDIEVWAPGCQEWLEVSSCSNCTDFQARRSNIRFRPEPNAKPEFVHTLNGSGLALPRVLISIIENYQQADGSVSIPAVLKPYMNADSITLPPA